MSLRGYADVMLYPSSRAEWDAEVALGWSSDGASNAPDWIYGVRIGETSAFYEPLLPAKQHDHDYRALRRMLALGLITPREAEAARVIADWRFRRGLEKAIEERLPWYYRPFRLFAMARCEEYWAAVRLFGARNIEPRAGEKYSA